MFLSMASQHLFVLCNLSYGGLVFGNDGSSCSHCAMHLNCRMSIRDDSGSVVRDFGSVFEFTLLFEKSILFISPRLLTSGLAVSDDARRCTHETFFKCINLHLLGSHSGECCSLMASTRILHHSILSMIHRHSRFFCRLFPSITIASGNIIE